MTQTLGIYIHVPFCAKGKCPYCDFYSVCPDEETAEAYLRAVARNLAGRARAAAHYTVDTVYFGGGTPSLLGDGLARLLSCVAKHYRVAQDAEITFEANPGGVTAASLKSLRAAGFNRLSLGMQSADGEELRALGRRHTARDVARAAADAHDAGFDNLSLDLMLCVPGQTEQSLARSVDFAASLSPAHISAYLLKVEPGTRFFAQKDSLALPDDDTQAQMYLFACERLEENGFMQYEISNFAKAGFASRHNLRYWDCGHYLGFGPAAHSFFEGRRFYYPRDLKSYLAGDAPVQDGAGGTLEEYIMLRLRLCEGLEEAQLRSRFCRDFSVFDGAALRDLEKAGLVARTPSRLSLTRKGFLVSNSVIAKLLFQ